MVPKWPHMKTAKHACFRKGRNSFLEVSDPPSDLIVQNGIRCPSLNPPPARGLEFPMGLDRSRFILWAWDLSPTSLQLPDTRRKLSLL